jgi:hypothetical protein
VVTRPGAGTVGKAVEILGTNLRGTTNVSFNGTAAAFEVVSDTLIATTVPVGASTGTVQVVTPGGTLSSTHRSGCGHKGYVGLRRPSLGIQRVAQPVAAASRSSMRASFPPESSGLLKAYPFWHITG